MCFLRFLFKANTFPHWLSESPQAWKDRTNLSGPLVRSWSSIHCTSIRPSSDHRTLIKWSSDADYMIINPLDLGPNNLILVLYRHLCLIFNIVVFSLLFSAWQAGFQLWWGAKVSIFGYKKWHFRCLKNSTTSPKNYGIVLNFYFPSARIPLQKLFDICHFCVYNAENIMCDTHTKFLKS